MNIIYKNIIAFALMIIASTAPTYAATLHVVMVCDTYAFQIEESVKIDLRKMKHEVEDIAYYSGLDLNLKIFSYESANSRFVDYVRDLSVGSDDTVLFYWNGHGYRTPSKDATNNPWPNFAFEHDWTGVDQLMITELLEEKNPRLVLSFTDTCNSYLPDEYAPILVQKNADFMIMSSESQKKANYKKLFVETSGTYIAAASLPGEYSYGSNYYYGGLFTYSFLEALHDEVKRQDGAADWGHLFNVTMDNVYDITTPYSITQTPQYEYRPIRDYILN